MTSVDEIWDLQTALEQAKAEIMRLRLENAALLAALERAESDLDIALERVRVALAKEDDDGR